MATLAFSSLWGLSSYLPKKSNTYSHHYFQIQKFQWSFLLTNNSQIWGMKGEKPSYQNSKGRWLKKKAENLTRMDQSSNRYFTENIGCPCRLSIKALPNSIIHCQIWYVFQSQWTGWLKHCGGSEKKEEEEKRRVEKRKNRREGEKKED